MSLFPCPHCTELSVRVKTYSCKKDRREHKVEFCLNKGCGYRKDLPTSADWAKLKG